MCGIVGYQGRFDSQLLAEMIGAVAHRGPDGEGCRVFRDAADPGQSTGFGHRRLAIIDLSDQGCQPIASNCTRCASTGLEELALTYNGEIYNFRELRADLAARGHQVKTQTDSEVLLHLYAEYGLDFVRRLNGIFAFAIRDGRVSGRPPDVERGDVLIARDHLGVKPLYYARVDEGFLFASELKALLKHPGLPRDLDPIAIHHQLAYLWTPAPRTVLRAVHKLPPASALLVRGGRIAREWSYYDVPYGQPLLSGTEDEIADELRERLRVAVERQLISDVPVGAFLSGGLDSSAVVSMMQELHPDRQTQCFCITFADEGGVDGSPADAPYAREVAKRTGARLEEIVVGPDVIGRLDHVIYHLDEPHADPAPINVLLIAERARALGIPVLLSGAGGDDIFSGYRRHHAAQRERLWRHVPPSMRRAIAARARAASRSNRLTSTTVGRRVVKLLEHADLTGDERTASYFWWGADEFRRSLYSPQFTDAIRGEATATPLVESLQRIPDERDPLNRMLYLETRHFLADHNLAYTDKMGMAAGVEIRVPLLDIDLVDFATRIPPRMKQRGAVGKAIFKHAMRRDLPRDVVYRPKSGFGAPLRRWIRNELRDYVGEALSPASVRARGLFDAGRVTQLVEGTVSGQRDGAYTVFALLTLEIWFRQFVDRS